MQKSTDKFIGLVRALTVFIGALFILSGCKADQSSKDSQSAQTSGTGVTGTVYEKPLVYEKDGEVYLTSGGNSITLGSTADLKTYTLDLNITLSENNEYLYYIEYKGNEDSGDMMRVKTDALSAPERIAQGVCAAEPDKNGERTLYITGIADMSGTLFLKEGNSEPQQIAKDVLPVFFGFSPDGKCIYYTVDKRNKAALYIKKGADDAVMVTGINDAPKINRGVNIRFDFFESGDDGRMLYTSYNEDAGDRAVYLFNADGTTETINEHCRNIRTLGSPDELLFTTRDAGETLWYKAPGKQAEELAKGRFDEIFEGGFTAGQQREEPAAGSARDRQFLILERGDEGAGETLYIIKLGSGKIKIAEADTLGIVTLGPGGCAVYQKDDGTYLSRETAAGRTEEKLSDGFLDSANISFDASGSAFYFIDFSRSNESQNSGKLIKYFTKDGARSQLMSGINGFEIIGGTPYVFSDDGWVYYIEGQDPVRVAYNYDSVTQAAGGAYLSDEKGGIVYAAQGESLTAIADSAVIYEPRALIKYYPPMAKDAAAVLDTLADDANYYLSLLDPDQYHGYPLPLRTIEQDIAIAGALSVSASDGDAKQAFLLFSRAFSDCALWRQPESGEEARETALSSMLFALNNYNDDF